MPADGHQKLDGFLSSTSWEEAMTPPHPVTATLPTPRKAPSCSLTPDGPKPKAALSRAGAPRGLWAANPRDREPRGGRARRAVSGSVRVSAPLGTHRLLDDARDDGVGQVQVLRSLRHPGTPCKARTASRGGAGGTGRAEPTPARPRPGPAPGAGPALPLTSAPSRRAPRPALPVPSCPAPAVAWRRGGAGGEGREGTEGAARGLASAAVLLISPAFLSFDNLMR